VKRDAGRGDANQLLPSLARELARQAAPLDSVLSAVSRSVSGDGLLAIVDAWCPALGGAAGDSHEARESLVRVLRRLVQEDPAGLRAWLEAGPSTPDAAQARSWLDARLWTLLGDSDRAGSAWDRVVEQDVGPFVERYLGRARWRAEAGDAAGAAADLREAFREPTGFREMERGAKLLARLRKSGAVLPAARRVKIGLLGSFTTQLLRPLLDLACFRDRIDAEIYEAEYGLYRQEILDPDSGLRRFGPDIVILAVHWRDAHLPPLVDDQTASEQIQAGFAALWEVCGRDLRAHVIQHNFDVPHDESHGHLSHALATGRGRILRRANLSLAESSPGHVSVLDFDGVAGEFGKQRWSDPGLWYLAKQHPTPDALPLLVDHYAAHVRAVLGLTRKVLVLDLDNTLWGGVIGEDGLAGIRLGGHHAEGEAHASLQSYAKELRERGVVLAVCSKNNDADAREPFEKHPEMLLSLDDIAVFKANWKDKATNLREIASELGLGLDSFVFVDDNPTERAWVRRELPEVAVPEVGDDISDYVGKLARGRYFEVLSLSAEDRLRAQDYTANAQRAQLAQSVGDMEEFLASLQMSAVIGSFDEPNLPRITQLVNKSNQFNLTTRRYTQEQLRACADSDQYVTRYFRLRDRYGDNGLVGVMLGEVRSDGLEIGLWLMSCRVLGRRMENLMCRTMMEAAKERGLERIVGRYIPTAKNAMVSDLYERLGFEPAGAGTEPGETIWTYDLAARPLVENAAIRIESSPADGD
jgi:FkbH-like protein